MLSVKARITHELLSRQLVTQDQLDEAITEQQARGSSLQRILIERGLVTEDQMLEVMSQGLGIVPITLNRLHIDAGLKTLIPRELALQYELIPVACMGQTLTIAMVDPLNVFAIDIITAMTGLSVNPMLATKREIREAIDQYYGTGVEETLKEIVTKTEGRAKLAAQAQQEAGQEDRLLAEIQETPVVKFTDFLLTKAIRMHASDLLIEPREQSVRVRFRIDGVFQEGQAPPKQLHEAIVSRIKVMAELNIAERRLPQDGHFTFEADNRLVDFRVSILPSAFGGNLCLRVLDKGEIRLDLEGLGFDPRDLTQIEACARRPHGMILSTGPTGSGKTTTLYSLIKMIDSPEKNIVTVEDPVEFEVPGLNQVNVKHEIGLSFTSALRSILRQDPDIIMVGEIRDSETADMAIKAALTGHLVLSTLHTNNAAGSVIRLVNMGVEPFLVNSCLMIVIGQRLVRKICQACKETYPLPRGMAEKLGIAKPSGEPVVLARGRGCRACFNSGYAGREEIRELVMKRTPEPDLERLARSQGMRTLREQGVAKAVAHITTLDEVFRTTVGEMVEA